MHVLRYMWYICGIVCTLCSILVLEFALRRDKATHLPIYPTSHLVSIRFPIHISRLSYVTRKIATKCDDWDP